MASAKFGNNEVRAKLEKLRHALLHLHKTLVESERATYEKTIGQIPSPNHLLKLLTNDPWFAWLHPISLLIVSVDEALDEKEPLTREKFDALKKEARRLLAPSEEGQEFSRHYFEALQRDPDVVFAHADAAKCFLPKKSSG